MARTWDVESFTSWLRWVIRVLPAWPQQLCDPRGRPLGFRFVSPAVRNFGNWSRLRLIVVCRNCRNWGWRWRRRGRQSRAWSHHSRIWTKRYNKSLRNLTYLVHSVYASFAFLNSSTQVFASVKFCACSIMSFIGGPSRRKTNFDSHEFGCSFWSVQILSRQLYNIKNQIKHYKFGPSDFL